MNELKISADATAKQLVGQTLNSFSESQESTSQLRRETRISYRVCERQREGNVEANEPIDKNGLQ